MDHVILDMLKQYNVHNDNDYENSLKQIMQEIALLGLWRAKFFEHAAFYGGTSLRILYQLDRFSEDLDFSLLSTQKNFNLEPYLAAIQTELDAFGFETSINMKAKNKDTDIQSAFLKANTQLHIIKINAPDAIQKEMHSHKIMKIKIEVDTDPPLAFHTETIPLVNPIPFWVKTYCLPDLLAGKLSAVLCRQWQSRVKGRDWYDFLWFIQRNTLLNIQHLEARLRKSGFYQEKNDLSLSTLKNMLHHKTDTLDVDLAKSDIAKFIPNPNRLDGWSRDLFHTVIEKIRV